MKFWIFFFETFFRAAADLPRFKKICAAREPNPGRNSRSLEWYHYTSGVTSLNWKNYKSNFIQLLIHWACYSITAVVESDLIQLQSLLSYFTCNTYFENLDCVTIMRVMYHVASFRVGEKPVLPYLLSQICLAHSYWRIPFFHDFPAAPTVRKKIVGPV